MLSEHCKSFPGADLLIVSNMCYHHWRLGKKFKLSWFHICVSQGIKKLILRIQYLKELKFSSANCVKVKHFNFVIYGKVCQNIITIKVFKMLTIIPTKVKRGHLFPKKVLSLYLRRISGVPYSWGTQKIIYQLFEMSFKKAVWRWNAT